MHSVVFIPSVKGPCFFLAGGSFVPYLGQFWFVLETLSSSGYKLAMKTNNVKKTNIRSGTCPPRIQWGPLDETCSGHFKS